MSWARFEHIERLETRLMFAGVTLVTHGRQAGFDAEQWVTDMADSIADVAGPNTPIYKLKITMVLDGNPYVDGGLVPLAAAMPSSASNKGGEVVIILDWAGASGVSLGWFNPTDTIASMVAPYLTS